MWYNLDGSSSAGMFAIYDIKAKLRLEAQVLPLRLTYPIISPENQWLEDELSFELAP